MLPCCALGALFIVQLMAFSRWFKRVILKKPPKEDENDYWMPEKKDLKSRLVQMLKDKRKMRIAIISLAVEVLVFAGIYATGGFQVIQKGFNAMINDAPATIQYLYECCFGG